MAPKIGVCEWALPVTGPFSVTLAAELGFDGLQLTDCGGASMQYPLNHPRIQAAYQQAAADNGMGLGSIHLRSVFQDKSIDAPPGTALADLAQTSIAKAIVAAAQLGIPEVMGTAIVRQEEALPYVIRNLRFACQTAAEHGVIFSLETNLINEQIYDLVEAVGPGLKLCFDTCNPFIYDCGPALPMLEDMLQRAPNLIQHYHVKDTRTEDLLCGHPAPVIAGTGGSDLATQARVILDSGYDGWIYSEAYYYARPLNNGGDFFALAQEDCKVLKQFFASK